MVSGDDQSKGYYRPGVSEIKLVTAGYSWFWFGLFISSEEHPSLTVHRAAGPSLLQTPRRQKPRQFLLQPIRHERRGLAL